MLEIFQISIICYIFWKLGEVGNIFNFWQVWIERLPWWLGNPLGRCYKCLTGQTLFWAYLILHLRHYNFIDHLFYPSCGILIVTTLNYLYERIEKN